MRWASNEPIVTFQNNHGIFLQFAWTFKLYYGLSKGVDRTQVFCRMLKKWCPSIYAGLKWNV